MAQPDRTPERRQAPSVRRGGLDAVKLLQDLVRIPSHDSEVPIADFIGQVTTDHLPGFKAVRLETSVAGRPSTLVSNTDKPLIVYIAHYDTVTPWVQKPGAELGDGKYDPFGAVVEDGKLFGLGAGDDKSGVATAMSGIAALLASGEKLPGIAMAFTSMEERSMQGMEAVAAHFDRLILSDPSYNPQFGISLNGADKQLGTGCRGALEIETRLLGRTGHAAIRTPGMVLPISAIKQGVDVVNALENELMSAEPTALGYATTNLADIKGGLLNGKGEIEYGVANKVPDVVDMLLEYRLNDGLLNGDPINFDTLVKRIHELSSERGLTVAKASRRLEMAAWLSDRKDLAWLEDIIKDVNEVNEVPDWPAREHGYDEVAMFNQSVRKHGFNVPTAIYGVVIPGFFHGPDEHVGIDALKQQEEVIRRVAQNSRFTR